MSVINFETAEVVPGQGEIVEVHATYLAALLYLVKRSNRYSPAGHRADVFQVDSGPWERVLVKTYDGQSVPTTEDVRSAVESPIRYGRIPA